MSNPSQEPLASSKAPNEDLKDMDVLCTFKIKIESQNLDHGGIKHQWAYPYQEEDAKLQSGTSSILQSYVPPASSKAPNQDLKDTDVLCTFKIKIENLE